MGFFNYKKGSAIPLGILLSLVLIAMLTVGCVDVIRGNPLFSESRFDNSDKLTAFNLNLQNIEKSPSLETSTIPVSGYTFDAFLFFSKGYEPIKLEYNLVSGSDENGDFVFKRPNVDVCQNKACICYSSKAKFWQEKAESPYIRPFGLYVSKSEIIPWEDILIQCVEASNPNAIFVNSRGLDTEFINYESQLLPLEIPMALQTSAKSTLDSLFDKNQGNELKIRRTFLKSNYVWKGGVVISGMGIAQNKEERKEKTLSVPMYNLTFQKIPETNITGVCIQPKCLYSNGIDMAKKQIDETERSGEVLESFEFLEDDLKINYPYCRKNNPDVNICLKELQSSFVNVFLSAQLSNDYTLYFHNETGITTIDLLKDGSLLSSTSFPHKMPKVRGQEKETITITGTNLGKLTIDSNNYDLKLEIDNQGNKIINFAS